MIGKVIRGSSTVLLLRYLFGPGKANEHTDPHLVATWDGDPARLEPQGTIRGGRVTGPLAVLLDQPVAAAARRPDRPVWHCVLRAAPEDPHLTDAQWRDLAEDVVHRTGLAPSGDPGGCRWVAVRHAEDHIHLVVTLARQDGRPARTSNDFHRVGDACRAAEKRWRLRGTAPRDGTAARRPTRAETEKSVRAGRREPPRVTLHREVRTAAAAAGSAEEFWARMRAGGLLVRQRFSVTDPGVVTGYAVALPGDRTGASTPVWFGGGRLAADLSWPQLATRWHPEPSSPRTRRRDRRGTPRLGAARREAFREMWDGAAREAAEATFAVRRLAVSDPAAASDVAHATGALLATAARAVEGRRGGALTDAAELFDRAARDLHIRTPAHPQPAGAGLRSAARLIALTGRAGRDETTQVLALVRALIDLTGAVADLRHEQGRAVQAAAARAAAERLTAATPAKSRDERTVPGSSKRVVHSLPSQRVVHSPHLSPLHPGSSRRKVQP